MTTPKPVQGEDMLYRQGDVLIRKTQATAKRGAQIPRDKERVVLERMGFDTYLAHANAKPVETDDWGALYQIDDGSEQGIRVVQVRNSTPEPDGSHKQYHLRVPPQINSPLEACAWTFDLEPSVYQHMKLET